MFDNLFSYFGPIWSAIALLGLLLLLFVVAAGETVRLLIAAPRQRPCLPAIRLMRAQRRLAASWTVPAHLAARWSRSSLVRRPGGRE